MRARTQDELLSPERLARVMGAVNPASTPRYFRELVRENHTMESINFLVAVMTGTMLFETVVVTNIKGGGQNYHIVPTPAPALARLQAAFKLIDIGVPRMAAVTDADGESVSGVIALPALELRIIQGELHQGRMKSLPRGDVLDAEELEYVIEEETVEGMGRSDDVDMAPPPIEETVSPERVAAILSRMNQDDAPQPKRRRNGKR